LQTGLKDVEDVEKQSPNVSVKSKEYVLGMIRLRLPYCPLILFLVLFVYILDSAL